MSIFNAFPADIIYYWCYQLQPIDLTALLNSGCKRLIHLTTHEKFRTQYSRKWLLDLKRRYYKHPDEGLLLCLKLLRRRNFYTEAEDVYFQEMGYSDMMIYHNGIPFFEKLIESNKVSCRLNELFTETLEVGDQSLIDKYYHNFLQSKDPLRGRDYIGMTRLVLQTCNIKIFEIMWHRMSSSARSRRIIIQNFQIFVKCILEHSSFYVKFLPINKCEGPVKMLILFLQRMIEYYSNHSSNNQLLTVEQLKEKIQVVYENHPGLKTDLFQCAVRGGNFQLIKLIYQLVKHSDIGFVTNGQLMKFYNYNNEDYHQLLTFIVENDVQIVYYPLHSIEYTVNIKTLDQYQAGLFTQGEPIKFQRDCFLSNVKMLMLNDLTVLKHVVERYSIGLNNFYLLNCIVQSRIFNLHSIDRQLSIINRIIDDCTSDAVQNGAAFDFVDVIFNRLCYDSDQCFKSVNQIPILQLIFDRLPTSRQYNKILEIIHRYNRGYYQLIEFIVKYAYSVQEGDKINWSILQQFEDYTDKLQKLQLQLTINNQ